MFKKKNNKKQEKVICLNCGYKQKIKYTYSDSLEKHAICRKCKNSFDI